MRTLAQVGLGMAVLAIGATGVSAQQMISARSGMVHYVEGKVLAGDQAVDGKFGNFPQLKENEILRTEEGRAEVLLTPGVFARVAENSSFRMITNRLIDTRLEFLTGSMILESDDMLKDNSVTVAAKDVTVHLRKSGIYRFDADPARLRVFKGTVDVEANGKTTELKEGRTMELTGDLAVERFDAKESDALSRWSFRRAEYVAMANVSAAKSLHDTYGDSGSGGSIIGSGGYGGYGSYGGAYPCMNTRSSLWAYNQYFGMYTYVPCSGRLSSPYGFMLWSPMRVYQVYAPRPVYNPGYGATDNGFGASRGYSSMPQTSGGYSGAAASVSSGATAVSSPGPSAGASSSAAGGVSHAGGGGGGGRR